MNDEDTQAVLSALSVLSAISQDEHQILADILEDLGDDIVPALVYGIVMLEGVVKFMMEMLESVDEDGTTLLYNSYDEMIQWLAMMALDTD